MASEVEEIEIDIPQAINLGLFAANAGWLFLFGFEAFWAALIVIVVYDYFLFVVLTSLDVNMLSRRPAWVLKLAAAAFGASAPSVAVAACRGRTEVVDAD